MIQDGETGFLVPPGDAPALADKLCEAWKEPRLDEIGHAARAAVQAYAPDETVQAFLDFAQSIVGKSCLHVQRSRAGELHVRKHIV
jgi:glycosyltransferase involved in cell wall biosynthesis